MKVLRYKGKMRIKPKQSVSVTYSYNLYIIYIWSDFLKLDWLKNEHGT